MEVSGKGGHLEGRQARKLSVTSRAEEQKLCQKLQGLETQYRHTADHASHEASVLKEKAKSLFLDQLRQTEQLTEEQELRGTLGLTRRQSDIRPMEVLATAQRCGIPKAELQQKRGSVNGVPRKTSLCSETIDEVPNSVGEPSTRNARKRNTNSSKTSPFKPCHHSGGCGFSRDSGGVHFVNSRRTCCSVGEDTHGSRTKQDQFAELARCRYLRTSVDEELSVDEVFSKD